MIKIIYNRDKHQLKLRGHAGSAPEGEDLVCAAATILVRTLALDCRNAELHGVVYGVKVALDKGYANVSAYPCNSYADITTMIFDSVCAGFALLAEEYPEYISYNIF